MAEGSTIAYVALALSVPASCLLFVLMRPDRALAVSVLGAMLFLPEGVHFKLPFLPPFSKHNLPYVCALLAATFKAPAAILRVPRERWFLLLAALLAAAGIGVALTNTDGLVYGKWRKVALPPLTLKDGLFTAVDESVHVVVPFFLGLALFRTRRQVIDLLASFAVAGLVYVPLAALELRLSPQLHHWVYGYHQHSFLQTLRFGGYRPMIFMPHGLALGRFFVTASLSALLIARERGTLLALPARLASVLLYVVLVLCKSTGAIVYGAAGLAVVALAGPRARSAAAITLALVVLGYPSLRAAGYFPRAAVEGAATLFGDDRRQSLAFRFENEEALLAKARERIAFGWGEYGRNATFDEMGRPAVTDGHWIILVGTLGASGFAAAFGILLGPIFVTAGRLKRLPRERDRRLASGLGWMIALLSTDLLPNGLWDDYPYLFGGALLGFTRARAALSSSARATRLAPPRAAHGTA